MRIPKGNRYYIYVCIHISRRYTEFVCTYTYVQHTYAYYMRDSHGIRSRAVAKRKSDQISICVNSDGVGCSSASARAYSRLISYLSVDLLSIGSTARRLESEVLTYSHFKVSLYFDANTCYISDDSFNGSLTPLEGERERKGEREKERIVSFSREY